MSRDLGRPAGSYEVSRRGDLIVGAGSLESLGERAAATGARRVLLVTDPGLAATPLPSRAKAILSGRGLDVVVFDAVREDPTDRDVEACVEFARRSWPDLIVGLGGGSSIDTAKAANLLLCRGGRVQDHVGWVGRPGPSLPLIAVPTTAGTGSEVQSYCLIADAATHRKIACGDPGLVPLVAILDPELTYSMPRRVTACTGLDALVHAAECAVTRAANPVSLAYATQAFLLMEPAFEVVLADPQHRQSRAAMLEGACLAGMAIEASMLGAAHSAANPLSARYGLAHGHAVAAMVPAVIRFNAADPVVAVQYDAWVTRVIGSVDRSVSGAERLARRFERWVGLAELRVDLGEWGGRVEDIPGLAAEASQQWTARYNPRPVGPVDFEGLYRAALLGESGGSRE